MIAKEIIVFNEDIRRKAKVIMSLNIREKDALHLACAIQVTADYFITTDKKLLDLLRNYTMLDLWDDFLLI